MDSKYSLIYPTVSFNDFLYPPFFYRLKRNFCQQNIFGFAESDLDKSFENIDISINEFDFNDEIIPPFIDTPPEIVVKNLKQHFLLPLVTKAEKSFENLVKKEYRIKCDLSLNAIVNLKEDCINKINEWTMQLKSCTHLDNCLTDKINKSLQNLLISVEQIVTDDFYELKVESKLKLNLSQRAVCSLLIYFNQNGFFSELYSDQELKKIAQKFFMAKGGKSHVVITNPDDIFNKLKRSSDHLTPDKKLESVLLNFDNVMSEWRSK